ncbi:hypothetical protein [Peribacillus loiseleuriae]|nr:hypothetical protein [Peribacillus loiseleuriae]
MAKHIECRFCDMGFPANFEDDTVCGGCGAEWEAAKILVEDEGDI